MFLKTIKILIHFIQGDNSIILYSLFSIKNKLLSKVIDSINKLKSG